MEKEVIPNSCSLMPLIKKEHGQAYSYRISQHLLNVKYQLLTFDIKCDILTLTLFSNRFKT